MHDEPKASPPPALPRILRRLRRSIEARIFIGIYRLGFLRSMGLLTGDLKETSYYRATRNPQVLGCVLYVIGFIILWPSWFALGLGLSLLVILHVMVLTEEEHLHNAYGQAYKQYCNKVPRYLGYPLRR